MTFLYSVYFICLAALLAVAICRMLRAISSRRRMGVPDDKMRVALVSAAEGDLERLKREERTSDYIRYMRRKVFDAARKGKTSLVDGSLLGKSYDWLSLWVEFANLGVFCDQVPKRDITGERVVGHRVYFGWGQKDRDKLSAKLSDLRKR